MPKETKQQLEKARLELKNKRIVIMVVKGNIKIPLEKWNNYGFK